MTAAGNRWGAVQLARGPAVLPAGFAVAAMAAYAALFADAYSLRLLTLSGIYALAVIGYQIAFGHAGALLLAQGAFFGLGGYVSGLLAVHLGVPFVLGFPAAILAAALAAGLIALPIQKLESHYLALATLGLSELAMLLVLSWDDVTGGANGFAGIPAIAFAGLSVGRGLALAVFVWLCVALGAWIAFRWIAGFTGHAFAAMRADPLASSAAGIDVGAMRGKALVLSAMFAAAAGALNVHTVGVISPDLMGFPVMVTILAMTVIGGSRSITGGIIAALLLTHLPEWFRFLEGRYLIAFGAAMLATVILAPGGLAPSLRRFFGTGTRKQPAPNAWTEAPLPARTIGEQVLDISGISKRFGGVTALSDISLSVKSGEVLGLIGPNGSGKSTLLNVVSGIIRPDRGRIHVAGHDVTALAPHRIALAGVGRSFQTPGATADLTACDSVAVACAARGVRYATARSQAMALLAMMGAEATATTPLAELPPASRRRVEIARALARAPRLLLLDEPAAGLDEIDHHDLCLRLRRIAATGVAIVIVEHNLPFLLGIADRVACLDGGRMISQGPPAAIRTDPRVIGAYFGDPGVVP